MSTPQEHRRTIRLRDFDYREPGFYFITICVKDHQIIFGTIKEGQMELNHNGELAQYVWDKLPQRFPPYFDVFLHQKRWAIYY